MLLNPSAHKGHRVRAQRILTVKPQHSGARFGYILEKAPYDPQQREYCGAVGELGVILSDGILVICFFDLEKRQTMAFAHPHDVDLTADDLSWPTNEGLVIL